MKIQQMLFLLFILGCSVREQKQEKIEMIQNWRLSDFSSITAKCLSADCGKNRNSKIVLSHDEIELLLVSMRSAIPVDMSSIRIYTRISIDLEFNLKNGRSYDYRLSITESGNSYIEILGDGSTFRDYLFDLSNDEFRTILLRVIE